MGDKNDEKIDYARRLLTMDLPYRDIQVILREKFGAGMSNSTLKKLRKEHKEYDVLVEELGQMTKERDFYKGLYFELLDKIGEKLNKKP